MTDAFIFVPQPNEGARVDNTLLERDGKSIYCRRKEMAAILLMAA